MIYDSDRIAFKPNIFCWLNMYICCNLWFMVKLFYKNSIFVVWVAFYLIFLFFKPNMCICYLLLMIIITFKALYRIFCNTVCMHLFYEWYIFNVVTHSVMIQVFNIFTKHSFYTMSGIFILLPTFVTQQYEDCIKTHARSRVQSVVFLLKHDIEFL